MHVLLLHLPIGIIILAAFLVLLSRWRKSEALTYMALIGVAIPIAAITSVLAAGCGLLLAQQGGYDADALGWHQWLGILAAIGCCACWWFKSSPWLDTIVLGTAALVSAAGHFGGNLTHGADYLFQEHKPAQSVAFDPEAPAYNVLIQPILDQKCVSCHNPSKAKGGLMLDSYEHLIKGGENGLEIALGSADSSELYRRLVLPAHEEKHMPPKGKAQLSIDEITLVAKWLDAGGDLKVKAKEIATKADTDQSFPKIQVPPAKASDLAALRALLVPVMPLGQDLPWVSVSLKGKKVMPDNLLKLLQPIAEQVAHLDASHSSLDDAVLGQLTSLKHLTRLNLANTKVTAAGLAALSGMVHLRYLNLTETNVDDAGIAYLAKITNLRGLGLMGTRISVAGMAQLRQQLPSLNITEAQPLDSTQKALRLNKPKIVFTKQVFDDTAHVKLEFDFKNIGLFYTLDQASPTTQSLRYAGDPIVLSESATVRAIAVRDGWENSEIVEQTFAKRKYAPDTATIAALPSPKYPAKGAASLYDNKLSEDRGENTYLGYEGEHMTAQFDFGKETALSEIIVHYFEENGAWIFSPKGYEAWYSNDGKRWTRCLDQRYPPTASQQPNGARLANLPLSQKVTARYLKLKVSSQLVCPKWHPGAGGKCWIFVDEVLFI